MSEIIRHVEVRLPAYSSFLTGGSGGVCVLVVAVPRLMARAHAGLLRSLAPPLADLGARLRLVGDPPALLDQRRLTLGLWGCRLGHSHSLLARRCRKSRRTQAEVSLWGGVGLSQGRRKLAASCGAGAAPAPSAAASSPQAEPDQEPSEALLGSTAALPGATTTAPSVRPPPTTAARPCSSDKPERAQRQQIAGIHRH